MNNYTYVHQNPWTSFDPEGLDATQPNPPPPPPPQHHSANESSKHPNTPPKKKPAQSDQKKSTGRAKSAKSDTSKSPPKKQSNSTPTAPASKTPSSGAPTTSAKSSQANSANGLGSAATLGGLWLTVGNSISGSGLSESTRLANAGYSAEGTASDLIASGAGVDSPIVAGYERSAEMLYADAAAAQASSYTASGAVSGYGAFGLVGAEGISATATTGLFGAAAVGGAAIGYGITQIPTGGGMNAGDRLGQGLYDIAPGFFDQMVK